MCNRKLWMDLSLQRVQQIQNGDLWGLPWDIPTHSISGLLPLEMKNAPCLSIEVFTSLLFFFFLLYMKQEHDQVVFLLHRKLPQILWCHQASLSRYPDHLKLRCFSKTIGSSSWFLRFSCKTFLQFLFCNNNCLQFFDNVYVCTYFRFIQMRRTCLGSIRNSMTHHDTAQRFEH